LKDGEDFVDFVEAAGALAPTRRGELEEWPDDGETRPNVEEPDSKTASVETSVEISRGAEESVASAPRDENAAAR
jgi:hypothetical protein